jgi:hypothetical protein
MKFCGLITFINFICSTTISNKRKCQDDLKSNHNQNDTVGFKTPLDNQVSYFVLNNLEQDENEQNETKRLKYSGCDFNYEDLSEFLIFTELQKNPRDKINDEQLEIMDLDDLSLNYDCKNSLTLEEKSDISKKASGYCTEVPKQISNLERTDKKTEGVPNLNQNFSLAVGSPNDFKSNDENVYEHLNTFINNIEILIFLNELIIAFKKYICNYISTKTVTSYRSWHLKRINNLDRDFAIISKYKLDEKLYSDIYDTLYDKHIVTKLKNLNVDKLLNFNRETYKHVENNVFKGVFWTKKAGFVRERLSILSDDHKKVFFFHEFFKLYKYSIEIPELITLGGLNKEEKLSKITFLLHIINLVAQSVDKIEDIKVFILCMISIAFEISYDTKFNIF